MCARVCACVLCMGEYDEDKSIEHKYAEIGLCFVDIIIIIIIIVGNSGSDIVVLPKCAYSGLF